MNPELFKETMEAPFSVSLSVYQEALSINASMDEKLSKKAYHDMRLSLHRARLKGRYGWWYADILSDEEIKERILASLAANKLQAVINYTAMLIARTSL